MDYPWYERISGSDTLCQGDFIYECPILIPPNEWNSEGGYNIDVRMLNCIILTQSCDLENKKVEIVLVCPFYNLEDFIERQPESSRRGKGRDNLIRSLKQGHLPAYHLLNKGESVGVNDFIVVDFRNVYGVHINFLENYIAHQESMVRLMPPYREHFSQAFARYFMRVGLPIGIEVN